MLAGCQQMPPDMAQGLAGFFKKLEPVGRRESAEVAAAGEVGLEPVDYSALQGWAEDNHQEALAAFMRSCEVLLARPDDDPVPPANVGGMVSEWKPVCRQGLELGSRPSREAARLFFEEHFTPLRLIGGKGRNGLFTGYYELALEGVTRKRQDYPYPVYGRPDDMVEVDLAAFDTRFEGERLIGQLKNRTVLPYPARSDIEDEGVKAQPVAWVKDPVDLFFLHIQGSGVLVQPDGSRRRIGYDAKNGRPYVALGKLMVERGYIPKNKVSADYIKDWLRMNPADGKALMRENPSYIFFKLTEGAGPVGAEGTVLTPQRSLAVDRAYIPLGAPVWVETATPVAEGEPGAPFRRLMVAQDTGSAIKGVVRGDVFWGAGEEAETMASYMASDGQAALLLPRAVADRLMHDSVAQ